MRDHVRLLLATLLLAGATASTATRPLLAQTTVCANLLPMGLLVPASGFTTGCARQFTLKLGANLGPDGNYILLGYPMCANGPCANLSGTLALQCAAANGYACCVQTGQIVPTIPGTSVGSLATGLSQRIAGDTDTRAGICYADYLGTGARVARVPIIEFPGGDRTQAQLLGFLTVFLVSPPAGTGTSTTVQVEFVALDPVPTRIPTWGSLKLRYR